MGKSTRRVAIVQGVRTPFTKRGTQLAEMSALELGKTVVAELLQRSRLKPSAAERVVFGSGIPAMRAPNLAREIVLAAGLAPTVDAFTVSRACATSYQAVISAAEAIQAGAIDCAIAGGTDSASDLPVMLSRGLTKALNTAGGNGTLGHKLAALAATRPRDLAVELPLLTELSTGLSMGESAERMARLNGISRDAQDELAHRSHVLAARAWREGRFDDEVMHVFVPPSYEPVERDNIVRLDSDRERYRTLEPAFDGEHGTITAGNSSAFTDGAAAVLLMNEARARSEGLPVLGVIRSYAFAALDPADQLLLGPAYATPTALSRAGLRLKDLDLIDMHEAFAAQVLSNTQAFESEGFARDKLGRNKKIGTVDWDRFNVLGGSIALGHPFAATGARQITQTLHELGRRGGELCLCTTCAAGGLGAAVVLEAA